MFDQYYSMYAPRIHRDATRISGGEPDFADDIEQEGLVALWRLALANTTGRYIYPAIVRHMLKYRRVELKSRVVSPVRRHYKRKEQGY